jgi:cellobiose-specific phosphotransferase system component IIC
VLKLGDALKYAKHATPANARKFAEHMVPHVVRPAQIIWNQAIGAVFLVFAASGFWFAGLHTDNAFAVFLSVFFGLVMGFFGVASFLKARHLSKL